MTVHLNCLMKLSEAVKLYHIKLFNSTEKNLKFSAIMSVWKSINFKSQMLWIKYYLPPPVSDFQ